MTNQVHFRTLQHADGPALAALINSSPSAGLISFTYEYLADVIEVSKAFATDQHGIVAQSGSEIIGMVLGDRSVIQLDGKLREAMYVSNLRVHPAFRRQGIARGLSDYGLEYVKHILGAEPVLYAAVPQGNISLAITKAFQFQSTEPIQGGIVPMLRSPPQGIPDLFVRTATRDDLDEVASGMNDFYLEHNLWDPVTAASLQSFLDTEVAGIRPNLLYVVTRGTKIAGGLSLSDRSSLVRMKLTDVPFLVRLLGSFLGLLPQSGSLQALTVRRVWFREGELEAARYLWQYLRYELRGRGTSLGIAYDPRDKLAEVFQIPFWLPMFKACYTVTAPEPLDLERLTYCVAGP